MIDQRLRSGFTLVELLLGMIIFGFIGLSLYQILGQGSQVYKRIQLANGSYHQALIIFETLDQDIFNALTFEGDAGEVRLTLVADDEVQKRTHHFAGTSFKYGTKLNNDVLWQDQWRPPGMPVAVKVTLHLKDLDLERIIYLPRKNS